MKLSIVIPVYNEAATIEGLLAEVRNADTGSFEKEIIVVDDGSTDNSREILQRITDRDTDVRTILCEANKGKGSALKAGFASVTGDFVLIQDADLEYHPSTYRQLLMPLTAGEMVVFGSRFLTKNKRRYLYTLGNRMATLFFNIFFGTNLTDLATCYKIFPTSLIPDLLEITNNDFVFDVVMLTAVIVKSGYRIHEVPIHYYPRTHTDGKKLAIKHGVRIFQSLFTDCHFIHTQSIRPTRGFGLLESRLAQMRIAIVNRIVPRNEVPERILDIGCGTYPMYLIQAKSKEKYGIDRVLTEADLKRFKKHDIQLINKDLHQLDAFPFPGEYFDTVTMLAVLEHLEPSKIQALLVEIRRVLKPGGVFIFTTPTPLGNETLKGLALVRLVSPVEIEEHKAAYSHSQLIRLLRQTKFSKAELSYFECYLNTCGIAYK